MTNTPIAASRSGRVGASAEVEVHEWFVIARGQRFGRLALELRQGASGTTVRDDTA